MNEQLSASTRGGGKASTCPSCGSHDVQVRIERTVVEYGAGSQPQLVDVVLPVHACAACGLEYLDHEGESLKHDAICRHLGRLTPTEVAAVRKRYDLTRNDFARITRLGEATLGRWERGELIQNPANDQLLYLLTFQENLARLRARHQSDCPQPDRPQSRLERFPSLARRRAEAFDDPPFSLVVGQN